MKKAILFLFMLVAATTAVRGQISYGAPNDWFVTVWDMSKPTNRTVGNPTMTISVPITGSNYTLYWEDVNNTSTNGIVNVMMSSDWSPYYLTVPSATGKYRLKAYKGVGTLTSFGSGSGYSNRDYQRLVDVEQWGTTVWSSFRNAFASCSNMDVTATDVPNLSACQDVSNMFSYCKSLVNANGSISGWNTANVTNMANMFAGTILFNQPLNWQTANVTNMANMFSGATAFNQPIGNWNTANVTNMSSMFREATSFNQSLNWNTSKVTNMNYMFNKATSFNSPFGSNWNTSQVTDMSGMFLEARAFNQPIGNWNTGNVTNMRFMLSGLYSSMAFNQPIGGWNTSKVTDMSYMFKSSTSFNQDLSGWDVSKVTTMLEMFARATAFNGDVNSWGRKMKNVLTIKEMFSGATSFNQSLDKWVLGRLASGNPTEHAFAGTSISCRNFTATLEGWAKNTEYVYQVNSALYFRLTMIPVQYGYRAKRLIEYLQLYKGIQIIPYDYYHPNPYVPDCDAMADSTSYIIEIDTRHNATGAATPTNRSVNINVVGTNFSVRYTEIGNATNTNVISGLNTGNTINLPSPGAYRIAVYAPVGSSITALSTTSAPLTNGYITNVTQWGTTKWQSLKDAFRGCTGISSLLAVDKPDLSECTSLEAMFQNCTGLATVPLIEDWNLSNVTTLKSMFAGAIVFNQPLNHLNVSHITDFSGMFSGASAFDRSLADWDLSGVTDGNTAMLNMLDNSGMSCLFYQATLSAWSLKITTPSNIRFGAANINYNSATVAIRNSLQTNKGWAFTGDILSTVCD